MMSPASQKTVHIVFCVVREGEWCCFTDCHLRFLSCVVVTLSFTTSDDSVQNCILFGVILMQ